jgi:hypothetical protein
MRVYEVYDANNDLLGTVTAVDAMAACVRLGGTYAVELVKDDA